MYHCIVCTLQIPGEVEQSSESGLEFQPFKLQVKPRDDSKTVGPGEYTDDQGRKIQRIVKKTIGPLNMPEEKEPSETTQEIVDKDGFKVTRVIKRTVVHTNGDVPLEEVV